MLEPPHWFSTALSQIATSMLINVSGYPECQKLIYHF